MIDLSNVIALALGSDNVLQIQDAVGTVLWQKTIYYNVNISAGSNGSVSVNGVSGNYSQSVPSGTVLTIEGTGNTSYNFDQWSDGDTSNPRTITVTGPVTLTAAFQAAAPQQPNDEIWYTTSNSQTIAPYNLKDVNNNNLTVVSNTYSGGKGIMKMSGDIYGTANSFASQSTLTSISLPSTLRSIGDSCFISCSNLVSFDIPDTVTTIGNQAFRYCASLTAVTIPDSVTSISDLAFANCSGLTSVAISDSVTSIGNSVFNNCSSLASITIPDNVTVLNDSLFGGCSSLTSVVIGESVASFGKYLFYNCTSLTSITFTSTTIVPELPLTQTNQTFYNVPSGGTLYGQPGLNYSNIMSYLSGWTLVQ